MRWKEVFIKLFIYPHLILPEYINYVRGGAIKPREGLPKRATTKLRGEEIEQSISAHQEPRNRHCAGCAGNRAFTYQG